MKQIILFILSLVFAFQALAGMTICFPINGQLHCFDIPVEYNPEWPWEIRHFDPTLEVELQRDLAILHLMDNLAGQMSPELGTILQHEVQALAGSFNLEFGGQLVFQKSRTDGQNSWHLSFQKEGVSVLLPKAYNADNSVFAEALFGPDPIPWIVMEGLRPETLKNLSVLATLEDMSHDLSRDVALKIQNAIAHAVEQLQLPKNTQIRM